MKPQTPKKKLNRRAAVRWMGGKTKLMPHLLPLMPQHRRYVSVFGGGGSDIFNKPKSVVEIFNDLNADVVNFFFVVRSAPKRKRLCFWLVHTPYSRHEYSNCLALLSSKESDPVKRAWAFSYCIMVGFNGIDPAICKPSNFVSVKSKSFGPAWLDVVNHIQRVGRRFREVVIEEKPWQDIIEHYDAAETFFYCDPPYMPGTRAKKIYKHEFSEEQHVELLTALTNVEGLVMLSGYDHALYAERLAKWRRIGIKTHVWSSSAKEKPVATEVVWLNYDKDGKRLV